MTYAYITHVLNMINCINFPCKLDDFSFVSVELAGLQPRMESKSGCGSVQSVANVQCEKF